MLKTFSATDIGKRRETNEDYVFTSDVPVGNLPNLFIVADGMGGHNAGDFASQQTVKTVVSTIDEITETEPKEIIKQAIAKANSYIRQKSLEDEQMSGMGTTLVVATCIQNKLIVANIGDSRLYVIGEGMVQVTRDHSLVEEMVKMGGIDKKSARNHPDKNIITRAVGVKDEVEADFFTVVIEPEDKILLCTDGLTNMLEDEEIEVIVRSSQDVAEIAGNLITAANEHGGRDNIGVILVKP